MQITQFRAQTWFKLWQLFKFSTSSTTVVSAVRAYAEKPMCRRQCVNAKNLNCFTWTTACRTRSAGQAYIVSYVGNEGQAVSPVQQVHCPLTFCITSTAGVLSTHRLYNQHSRCIVHSSSVLLALQVHCPLTICIASTAGVLSTHPLCR